MIRHDRARIGTWIRVVVALGLFGLAVGMNRAEIRGVLHHRLDITAYLTAIGLYLAACVLAVARWFMLVRALDLPFRFRDALRLGFIGLFFNLVIPGAIGGDFIKAAFLGREQARKTRAIATVVVDRLIALVGLFGLAAATGMLAWAELEPTVRRLVVAAWIALAVVGVLLAIAFWPALYRPLARRFAHRERLAKALHEWAAMGSSYRERPGVLMVAALMATATYGLHVLAFHAASRALFPEVPSLADQFLIVPLVLFSTAIPLPFGALGVSEQIGFALFRLAHFSGGAVAMMGFRTLQYVGAAIGSVLYMTNRRQVQTLAEEARHRARDDGPQREGEGVMLSPSPAGSGPSS
jgi:uncharacterized protein (TIRG00374 family)